MIDWVAFHVGTIMYIISFLFDGFGFIYEIQKTKIKINNFAKSICDINSKIILFSIKILALLT